MIGRGKSTSSWLQMLAFQWIGDPDPDPDPNSDHDHDHEAEDVDLDRDNDLARMVIMMLVTIIMIHECGVDGGQESNFREDKKSRRHMALLKLE